MANDLNSQNQLPFDAIDDRHRTLQQVINHVYDQMPKSVVVVGKKGGKRNVSREKIILILEAIAFLDRSDEGCWASVDRIAQKARCDRRTAQACIRWLEFAGLIANKKRHWSTMIRRIVVANCQEFSPKEIPWMGPELAECESGTVPSESGMESKSKWHHAKVKVAPGQVKVAQCRPNDKNDIVIGTAPPPPPDPSFSTMNDQRALRGEPESSIVDEDLFWSLVDRILRYVSTNSADDMALVYKVAVWQYRREISQDQVERCLETISRQCPSNPVAYFTSSIRSQLRLSPGEMNSLIRRTPIPSFVRFSECEG